MKDKERLELLENGSSFSSDDITFLLKQSRLYQIQRDDTRKACHKVREENKKLEQQNKRYRKALEFYADEKKYDYKVITDSVGDFHDMTYMEIHEVESEIYYDCGEKAIKALEGEE